MTGDGNGGGVGGGGGGVDQGGPNGKKSPATTTIPIPASDSQQQAQPPDKQHNTSIPVRSLNNGLHENMEVDDVDASTVGDRQTPNKQNPAHPQSPNMLTANGTIQAPISPKSPGNTNQSGNPLGETIAGDMMDDSTEIYNEDDEARPTGDLEMKVSNISKFKDQDFVREKKCLSNAVKIRCLPWKILFMLRVANTPAEKGQRCVGFFLQCNAESDSTTWNCHAKVELRIVAQKKGCEDVVRKIEHNFFSKENDWGFSSFITMTELLVPEKGLVHDDSILLKVHVVADAPHGVDWDSKRHTGFVGLKNQGATCYMNSLLQTLYFTNKLRKVVYLMPTESDDTARSVPLALQRVFYELQHSDRAVGTKKLTRSFGWETLDSFMQHDAQELCRVLMDNMESKMKGTSVEDTIPSLFRGKTVSYIKCKHVCFESKREENFYDIQLKVKGNQDITAAFKEYVDVETLDQDNKYDAGQHGLQEAEKGVTFLKFPPVLYLQLMRFQYDHMADANIKINDRFEFPYRLNLDQFLRSPGDTPATYVLHAVLVHSGDNHGGHYVVYMNPRGDNKWYKFDDDVVSRCSRKEAIALNYGGYEEDLGVKLCTNAYMLVYIEESLLKDVLCPVEDCDIPETLRDRFTEERRIEAQKRREKADSHLYASINLVLDEDFYGWQGFDLYNQDALPLRRIRVPKNVNYQQLVDILAEFLHQTPEKIRPWTIAQRKNQTYRVVYFDVKENVLRSDNPLTMWVQSLPPDSLLNSLPSFDIADDLLVFLKYYNPRTQTIHYCGTLTIRLRSPISTIIPTLYERAKLPPDSKLILFEERRPLSLERITNVEQSIDDCVQEVMDGNIIVFQQEITPEFGAHTTAPLLTAADYFRDFYNRVDVLFIDKTKVNDDDGFVLNLSVKLTYWQMAAEVARYLNTEQEKLQFFRAQTALGYKEPPGSAVRCNFEGSLKDLLTPYTRPKSIRRLYYQRLPMRITDLENMRQFRCIFVSNRLKEVAELVLNVSKTSRVKELLDEARKQIELPTTGSGRLRLMEVVSSKITQEFPEELKINNFIAAANKTLRVEEVPTDELEVGENETIIYVAHFHKDSFATFGVPFTLKIRDGESFAAVRDRIQHRLDVSDKEFEKWRFAVVATRASYLPEDAESGLPINISIFNTPNITGTGSPPSRPWLGLEHKFPPKRARYTFTEKPIKIHN